MMLMILLSLSKMHMHILSRFTLLLILNPPLQDIPRRHRPQQHEPHLREHRPRLTATLENPVTNLPQPHPALRLHRQRKQPRALKHGPQRAGPAVDVRLHQRGHSVEVASELCGAERREVLLREDGGPKGVLQLVQSCADDAA